MSVYVQLQYVTNWIIQRKLAQVIINIYMCVYVHILAVAQQQAISTQRKHS